MKKTVIICSCLLSIAALAACSSFKRDYEVIDASVKKRPEWVADAAKINTYGDAFKYRYFSGENENASKRLCETGARADADKKLAAEIVQMIKNTYAESLQNEEDAISSYTEEALGKSVKVTVSGSQLVGMYWEKRAYTVDLGAEKDRKTYFCHAVSQIEKTKLERVVDASINNFVKGITGNRAKDKALEALKAAEKEFIGYPENN